MRLKYLHCHACGDFVNVDSNLMTCKKCGCPLILGYDTQEISKIFDIKKLKNRIKSVWRYKEFLPPIDKKDIVTLGEGFTAITDSKTIKKELNLEELSFKLEYVNPTGSLKDRGSTVMISKMKQLNIKSIADDSSGNAGASISAYSAKAGIDCTIYVPENTPIGNIIQTIIYGANIVEVPGGRTSTSEKIMELAKARKVFYASHNLSPYFLDGNKTFALEIIDQTEGALPDHIIFPTGGGSLFLGSYFGFTQAKEVGLINKIPKLHIVQHEACAPLVKAFMKRLDHVEPVKEGESVAGGLKIVNPPRGMLILKGLYETEGSAVSVNDEEVIASYLQLSRKEGIFCEPTSAAALSGLKRLLDGGQIKHDESIIVPITGFGLKDSKNALKIAKNRNLIKE